MSNPELFLIKDDKEDLSNLEIVKRSTWKYQSESIESLSSSSESHSQDQKEENYNNQEKKEEYHESKIVHKQVDSESNTSSSEEKLKLENEEEEEEEEEEDGFRTPTSLDHRISVATQCPPPPRKIKPPLKRKASYDDQCNCRNPLDLSKEVELLFPITQHIPLSDSYQSTKKVHREEPK